MKIYIYWDARVYFTSFKEAQKFYENHCDPTTFNDFLANNYGSEEIFNFTEDDKIKVMEDYKHALIQEVKSWLEFNCDEIETEVEAEADIKQSKKVGYMYE